MVHIANLQKRVRVPRAKIRRLAARLLGRRDLSVAVLQNAAMRRLNRRFLGHDYATDVLSFRLDAPFFGEVVVSAQFAAAEARRRRIPAEEELLRYVLHGILHLLGYDDRRPADREKMWARQEEELRRLLG